MSKYYISFSFIFIICLSVNGQIDLSNLKLKLKKTSNSSERVKLITEIINYYQNRNLNDSTFFYAEKLKYIADKNNDSLVHAKYYTLKAKTYYLNSDYSSTEKFALKAIKIYRNNNLVEDVANTQLILGNIYQIQDNNKSALQNFTEALPYLKNKDKISGLLGLAAVYGQINNLEAALNYYNEAYKLSTTLNLEEYKFDIYNGLSAVYNNNGDYEKALESLEKALNETKKNNRYLAQVVCYHNIGYLQKNLKNFREAKVTFENGISIFNKISNTYMMASIYMYYSEVIAELGNISGAEDYILKSENLFNEINNSSTKPSILNIKAKIEGFKGDHYKAIDYLKQANSIKHIDDIEIAEKNKLLLANFYDKIGDVNNAYKAYKNYTQFKDSIRNSQNKQKIERLKLQFDISEYQQDLKNKEQELNLLNEAKKASNYRNTLLFLLACGLVTFIYRQRKLNKAKESTLIAEKKVITLKEEKLSSEMAVKNTEITEYAIHISERNRMLEYFTNEIKKIKAQSDNTEVKSQLQNLQFYAEENLDINREKIIYNSNIKNTEQSFISKLKEKYPNLTPKEIKVATYALLKMSSKTISNQMGISIQSVNNYRFTIRKKLNIPKNKSIDEYLRDLN